MITAGISDDEAIKLIALDPLAFAPVTATPAVPEKKRKGVVAQDSWKQGSAGGADTLTLSDGPSGGGVKRVDPFEEILTGLDVRAPFVHCIFFTKRFVWRSRCV